jgi:hypothetical protein
MVVWHIMQVLVVGKGHLIAGIGIRMASLASRSLGHMQFVAERDRLLGRGMGRDVVPHLLLRWLRALCSLLRARCEANLEGECDGD